MTSSRLLHAPRLTLPQFGDLIENGETVYHLGRPIGQGYFGKVYECTDQWGNELVAKVLLPRNQTYSQVRTQWTDELRKLLLLRHPNITYAYDAFECDSTFYLIIERCGSDMNSLLSMPGFSGELWLPAIARDILQGVHFMHRSDYVHKDLHPGNVFVSWARDRMLPQKDPVVSFKIGDLGISRLETDINVFGTMLAQWMRPPESYLPARFGPVDRRVDVYHAGLLLLSLLLGRFPEFTRDEIVRGGPRELAESLSSVYSPAIGRALRRHVANRTQSATAFWSELRSVMPAESIP